MMSCQPFIVDFGRSVPGGAGYPAVSRYSVWRYDKEKMTHQVVDGGDDLSVLHEQYGNSMAVISLPLSCLE
jgi:hypothetical protein